jgi:hypothetical protein
MSAATFLVGLYPPAVRERWGAEIGREVATAGARSWPDALTGALRLWVHPSDWPETFAGQTRRVVTVTTFVITAVAGLLLRSAEPSDTVTADLHHPLTSLWVVPLLLGVILAVPVPELRIRQLRRLISVAVRTLAAPALAGLGVLLLAWTGVADRANGPAQAALVVYYWSTLAFIALRLCQLVARVARLTITPTTGRLSAALTCVGVGLALAAVQGLLPAVRSQLPGYLAQTLVLGLLAGTAFGVARDLRRRGLA